jgi:uncharacterized protein YkwD
MKYIGLIIAFITSIQLNGQDSSNLEFLDKINQIRLNRDLDPLLYDDELYILAKKWCTFIINEIKVYSDSSILAIANVDKNYFHIKADERFDNVLKRKSIVSIGENLSFLMNTKEKNNVVEVAFNGWKHSRSHYLQMVNPEKTHVAYYCCYDNVNRRYVCISVYAKKRA